MGKSSKAYKKKFLWFLIFNVSNAATCASSNDILNLV